MIVLQSYFIYLHKTIKPENMETKAVEKKKIDVLKGILEAPSIKEQFQNALKENSSAFIASVIDLYNSDKGLQECEPKLIVMECLKAAVLKLPINKALGFAYVIKFNNRVKQADGSVQKVATPVFVPGYKGYIQMAMRTGQYRTINTDVVYEGEIKTVNKLTGEISFDGKKLSDKIIGYFSYFELLNGFSKTLYVTVEDMAKYAKRNSPSIKYDSSVNIETLTKLVGKDPTGLGWTGDFDSMALKTTLRNLLSKFGYLSIEMQNTLATDIESERESEREEAIASITLKNVDIQEAQVIEEATKEEEQPPY